MYATEFFDFLVGLGYSPQAPIPADGKIQRCPAPGDKPRQKSGWYALHLDPVAGVYCDWRDGEKHTWRPENQPGGFDREASREKLREQQKERAERQAEEHKRCRAECGKVWEDAAPAADDHPYLLKKQVRAHGIKVLPNGRLVIPLRDGEGALHGVQYIPGHGNKWFHKSTSVIGHYFLIGEPHGRILVAEGYATCATLYQVTGHAVAVAFTSGNLRPVAEALRASWPYEELVICGDDDRNVKDNPGRTKAVEAADAVEGSLAIPVFRDVAAGTDFNDLYVAEGESAVRAQLEAAVMPDDPPEPDPPQAPEPAGPVQAASLFISAADFPDTPITVDYLIDDMVEQDTTGQLFGPSAEGKSFVAFDWSMCIGTGRPVNGNPTKQGLVLYLAGEGHGGIKRRVRAWRLHNGVPREDVRLVHISEKTIRLDGSGVAAVTAEGLAQAKAHGMPVALIVVDTLARHMEGDENSTQDMSAFIHSVDVLRASFPGAVALIVHHTGHGDGTRGRGSSVLRPAMDFDIHCDKGLLTFLKMKDADTPEPLAFKLHQVVVGDNAGKPLTSCVVEYVQRSELPQETALTGMEVLALETLVQAAAASELADGDRRGALLKDWRKAFYDARRAQDRHLSTNTLKQAFNRAADGLSAKKLVSEHQDLRIPTAPRHQNEIGALIAKRVQGTQMVLVP